MWLLAVASLLILASIAMLGFYAPIERTMGVIQKIFYFHVSSAMASFLGFGIVFVASIAYLVKRDIRSNLLGYASAKVGLLFCTLVFITGPLWAKAAWGVWWTWDPRLTTTMVLWFMYLAYLILHSSIEDEGARARFCAVYGIIAFIDVPIVYLSVRLWRSVHPAVFKVGESSLHPRMLHTFLVTLAGFISLAVTLIIIAYRQEVLVRRLRNIEERMASRRDEPNMIP